MTRMSPIYNHAARLADQCGEDFELYLENYQEAAEEACRGRLVNRRGIAAGVRGVDLLRGIGHHMKRAAYASEEFRDYLERQPLLTRTEFERQWLDTRVTIHEPLAVGA